MSVKIVKHKDISALEIEVITTIKDQNWCHGIASQIKWIENQFLAEDLHVMSYKEERVVAYVGLNRIKCLIDGEETEMWGIGNVCVDKSSQGTGLGIEIMREVNAFLTGTNQPGILLCHKNLCRFYSKVDWKIVSYRESTVNGVSFAEYVMSYNKVLENVQRIDFNKNF